MIIIKLLLILCFHVTQIQFRNFWNCSVSVCVCVLILQLDCLFTFMWVPCWCLREQYFHSLPMGSELQWCYIFLSLPEHFLLFRCLRLTRTRRVFGTSLVTTYYNKLGTLAQMANDGCGKSRGALIVLEGLDRSGKTSQASRILSFLQSEGFSAELWRFPDRKTCVGEMISSYLANKSELDDHTVHLLFSANRWEKRSILSCWCFLFYIGFWLLDITKKGHDNLCLRKNENGYGWNRVLLIIIGLLSCQTEAIFDIIFTFNSV